MDGFDSVKCVVYDLDGTIVDSMHVHEEGWRIAGDAFFVPVTGKLLQDLAGMPINEVAAKLLKTKDPGRIDAFVGINHEFVLKNVHRIGVFDDFLETHKELTLPVWVCTSSTKDYVDRIFSGQDGISYLKDKAVYREMYRQGKPNPEPLLLTFRRAGFKANDCLYIGDAYNDYAAAKAAGARFILYCHDGVPDPRIPKDIPIISRHTELLRYMKR